MRPRCFWIEGKRLVDGHVHCDAAGDLAGSCVGSGDGYDVSSGGCAGAAATASTSTAAATAAATDARADQGCEDQDTEDRPPATAASRDAKEQKSRDGYASADGEELIQRTAESAAGCRGGVDGESCSCWC